ncbi:ATP-binding protein [Chlamydiia bacterium]|nr:ATP-binding protein [Chlamydiia bacterium]
MNKTVVKLKVGILGTHGIGKTTLAYELAQVLQKQGTSVSVLTELARECPYELGVKQVKEATTWLITRQISRELELQKNSEVLLCDRTSIDALIYTLASGKNDNKDLCIGRAAYDWLRTYDKLIWIRPNQDLVDDGFRMTDIEYRNNIDAIFRNELKGQSNMIEVSQDLVMDVDRRYIFIDAFLKTILAMKTPLNKTKK